MFRYVGPESLDRAQWDALITTAPNGLIYALSWYLDIVSPGWAALVKHDARGRYVAALPLPVQRRFGFRYLKQPLFAQQLGLFSLVESTPADWAEISQLLQREFRFITRYSFNTDNPALSGAATAWTGFETTTFHTYYLSLNLPHNQLVAAYKPNRRWRLNQARRRQLSLEPGHDIDQLLRIFDENTAPNIYGIIGEEYEYRLLRALYAEAQQQEMAQLWQARTAADEVVAMIMLFEFNGRLTYIFNASTEAGKAAGAISLLLDEVFRQYATRPICFDFEAPEVASIAHFYGSFGSTETPFLSITLNRLPWPLRQLKAARTALLRAWR
ncbi:GNAT family N-acetyltransferase [Hymenobacter actinosclerus]|uniref:Acetyltransferase (GNAT) domain-containing protein n=1 Tax=Hymenobacter actinosclerus TaxID=82805 RepID=A0A1I0DCN5_9BACT|nr:GNAT family N-acetyltransferase [Hymenobacter actinosclerus]SET30060.1 Acetyltransferase (GNAT) domain-containing protein [Hymenobacter actinosclerus]